MTEFNLSVIMKKPTKELTNLEKYLRYKNTFKKSNTKWRNAHKEEFAKYTKKWADKNPKKIREKAKRIYNNPEEKIKALVRAKTRYDNRLTGFCNDCLTNKKTEFHHLSYIPNRFIEVCKECHYKKHGRILYVK